MFGVCLLVFIGLCIYHASEPALPADYHRNWKLEQEDANKVRMGQMSKREFIKNMENGKYKQERCVIHMAELILIGIFVAIWAISKISVETKLDNYDMSKVDTAKMTKDMCDGVSVAERRRRCVNGYYDKK